MFHVEESDFGPFRRYRFHHDTLGHGFDVVPAAGANVTALRFDGTNVLDSYENGDELKERHWGKSDILFPFPNRLRDGRYSWRGRDYSFPQNNASTQNAIHGFVRHESFEPHKIELTREHASMTSRLEYQGTNPSYPFPFVFDVTFTLTAQAEFSARFCVTNRHHESIPAGLGWHPYFHLADRPDDHLMKFPACERIDIDERMIPTGKRLPYSEFLQEKPFGSTHLDTCFAVSPDEPSTRVTMRTKDRSLSVEAPRKTFPFFQVFSPPMRTSIAIEPMTCNIDAFHNGEGLVEIGSEPWIVEFRVIYSRM